MLVWLFGLILSFNMFKCTLDLSCNTWRHVVLTASVTGLPSLEHQHRGAWYPAGPGGGQ